MIRSKCGRGTGQEEPDRTGGNDQSQRNRSKGARATEQEQMIKEQRQWPPF